MRRDIDHYITTTSRYEFDDSLKPAFKRVKRLEWITFFYLITVSLSMYLAMGSSQAMKAAWVEDVLSIFPCVAFLIASRNYSRKPDATFPYGYHKAFTVAFVAASLTLLLLGTYLLIDSIISLVKADHPTIGTINILGKEIWMGWVMLLALLYSFLPAMILGNMKMPYASKLHVKVLYADAQAQKADWMTALGGMIGVIGIGFGLWWADPLAAIFIASSIVHDGYMRTKDSVRDLMEEIPYTYDNSKKHPVLEDIIDTCLAEPWIKDVRIRFREHGMVFFGDIFVIPTSEDGLLDRLEALHRKLKGLSWHVEDVVIFPVKSFPNPDAKVR